MINHAAQTDKVGHLPFYDASQNDYMFGADKIKKKQLWLS
jgi:hypothetical protein